MAGSETDTSGEVPSLAAPRLVVKLGGSLLARPEKLNAWLDILDASTVSLALIPGGGPFADSVREVQKIHDITDQIAHEMAVLAMHQTGLLMAAGQARLRTTQSIGELGTICGSGGVPVLMPSDALARDETFPRSWLSTSDAIAAWLAEKLGGVPLLLVKSCKMPQDQSLEELAEAGIIDDVTPGIAARAKLTVSVLGDGDEARLADLVGATGINTLPPVRTS